MALRYSDVDFENRLVTINKSVVRVKTGETITKSPKSDAGTRVIDAPAVLIDFLQRERAEYFNRRLQYGADFQDNDLLICQPNGQPYDVDYFTHKLKQLLKRHGLPVCRLHDLRHSSATYMLKLGISPKVMQARLGHSTVKTTLDIYSHVLDDMGRAAAETLNDGLQSLVTNVI